MSIGGRPLALVLSFTPAIPSDVMHFTRLPRSLAVSLCALALALVASACGSSSPYQSGRYNGTTDQAIADLGSADRDTALAAATWLQRNPSPRAIPALSDAIDNLQLWPDVASTCCYALAATGDVEAAWPVLQRAIVNAPEGDARGSAAVRAVGRLPTVHGIDPLVQVFGSFGWADIKGDPVSVPEFRRLAAVNVLTGIYSGTSVALLNGALLRDPSDNIRRQAAVNLGAKGDARAITALIEAGRSDESPRVRGAAEESLSRFEPNLVTAARLAHDDVMLARLDRAQEEELTRTATRERRLSRQRPPVPEAQMIEWVQMAGEVGVWIDAVELVRDHAPPEHPLGYNGQANGGEMAEYRVRLRNASVEARLSSSAYAYSYDPFVTIINRELYIPRTAAGASVSTDSNLLVMISPDIPEQHRATFYLETGDSFLNARNENLPVYRPFTLSFTNPTIGPIEITALPLDDDDWGRSDGDGDGEANWGERLELPFDVVNLGSSAMSAATLRLDTLDDLLYAITKTSSTQPLPANRAEGFHAEFDVLLPGGYAGTHSLDFLLTLATTHGDAVYSWKQRWRLEIGETTPQPIGPIETYEPFDMQTLLDMFVINQEFKERQDTFLEQTELRFFDARDTLLAQY